jgi:hypothetical protein
MRFELSLLAYDVVREQETKGDPHPTLARGKLWYDPDERRHLARDVHAELERAGLARGGRLSAEFLDVMNLLERPEVEYYTRSVIHSRPVSVRVARSGRTATLVIANDDTMYVYPSHPDSAIRDVVAQLPDTPTAHIQSLSFAQADLDDAEAGHLSGQTSGSIADAKTATRWLKAPRIHAGRLYVGIRKGHSGRRRTEVPPFWTDTEQGRIVMSQDSNGWFTLFGAAGHDLERLFGQMENRLR